MHVGQPSSDNVVLALAVTRCHKVVRGFCNLVNLFLILIFERHFEDEGRRTRRAKTTVARATGDSVPASAVVCRGTGASLRSEPEIFAACRSAASFALWNLPLFSYLAAAGVFADRTSAQLEEMAGSYDPNFEFDAPKVS